MKFLTILYFWEILNFRLQMEWQRDQEQINKV